MNKLNKIIATTLAVALLAPIIPATNVSASASAVEYNYDSIVVKETERAIIVTDEETQEKVSLTYSNNEKTEGIYVDTDGTQKQYYRDPQGNIYLDGIKVIEVVQPNFNRANKDNVSAASGQWTHFNTYRTTQSLQLSVHSLSLAIVGLIPGIGQLSWFFGVPSVISGIQALARSQNEIYIEIKQYHSSDYRQIKDEISLFKNSNYTGLIERREHVRSTF